MKKLSVILAAASLSALLLAGCGKEAAPQESTAASQESAAEGETDIAKKEYPDDSYADNLKPEDYVTLGDYLGVEVAMAKPVITDTDVDSYIEYARANNKVKKEVTGRAVQSGDVANIDYEGKKDGVAFEGGTAEKQDLEIGSHSFIEGFEDGIIGMKAGETKELNLTFPEAYQNADLAGQDVVFTVKLNNIYVNELPELNDEFVTGLGIENVSTMDDYRTYVRDNLEKSAQSQYEAAV